MKTYIFARVHMRVDRIMNTSWIILHHRRRHGRDIIEVVNGCKSTIGEKPPMQERYSYRLSVVEQFSVYE